MLAGTDRVPAPILAEMVVAKFLAVAIALLVQCWPAGAAGQNCMNDYYRTKAPGCVDSMLSQLRQTAPNAKGEPNPMIGFLAQLFRESPAEKQRILNDERSDYVKSVDLVALYRADLLDDARKFADKNQLSVLRAKLEAKPPAILAAVKPSSNPGDNDLLIGAYMASGDTALIQRILDNFSGADDGTVSDALRMGYMKSKFGSNLVATGRENVMAPAVCAKYQCKTEPARFFRVLTLASAFWALQSLAQNDEGISKTVTGFFDGDARLKNLLAGEEAAFENYVSALTMHALYKPDQPSAEPDEESAALDKAALAYEKLEPPHKVFDHIEAFVGSGKSEK
jgi:hypothetical protein